MDLTDYTTYDEVRAVLGVSSEEIENATLALPMYSTNLDLVLSDVSDLVSTNYETIAAIDPVSRTAAQVKYYNIVRLYSAYVVANDLLTSLPMFGFKSVTDGRAEIERFDQWEEVKNGVKAGLVTFKGRLVRQLAAIDPGYIAPPATTRTFIVGTGLATDPVTSA